MAGRNRVPPFEAAVKGTGRVLRGRWVALARQETWALLLVHNMTAAIAARAAGPAGSTRT